MLDDLKMIHERDAQDALGIAGKQADQYLHTYGFDMQLPSTIENVVVAGMGGSGLAAKAFASWPGVSVPYQIVQGYDLPAYVSQNTLLICSSYSGNTEETLSVIEQALQSKVQPMIVVVASGGKLLQIAQERNLPHLVLPAGFQPRMTFGYQFRALAEIFEQAGLAEAVVIQLELSAEWLRDVMQSWQPDVPTAQNPAKQLALELMGSTPVVYAGPLLFPAAYKWKISFNENAKNVAWCGMLPEFNHNEFLGWTSHPIDKPYKVIDLRSKLEHPQVQKRFEVSERLLSGKRPAAHVVEVVGENATEQLLWSVALGDFVSLYVALLNGLNPTPVELIEKFKRALSE